MQQRIRRARAGEWEEYRSLRLAMLRDAPKAFDHTVEEASRWSDERWRVMAHSRSMADSCWFVAVDDDRWVGQVQGRIYGRRCYLLEVYLSPGARGSGLLAPLVQQVAAWADARGFAQLWLDVGEQQLAARRAYARLGFVETGESSPNGADPSVTEFEMVADVAHLVGQSPTDP